MFNDHRKGKCVGSMFLWCLILGVCWTHSLCCTCGVTGTFDLNNYVSHIEAQSKVSLCHILSLVLHLRTYVMYISGNAELINIFQKRG